MSPLAKQRRKRRIAARWLAAACGGLLAALVLAASAQTPVPVAVASPSGAAAQTNTVSQTAPAASTNAVSLVEALQSDPGFQSYTNLLEHSLFVPASNIGGGSDAGDTGPTFAGGLRLTGFFVRGKMIEASLEDRNELDKKLFVKMGDVIADTEIKVVGFDLRGRAVLLKKGDEEGRLEYESETMPAPATAGKPGAPGAPAVPGAPGAAMPRPGMPPTPQPGMPGGVRPAMPGGVRSGATSARAAAAGAGDDSNSQASRRQSRQQTIARLQQMLQTTTDPAAKQRLQSYIQMLEKANAQE